MSLTKLIQFKILLQYFSDHKEQQTRTLLIVCVLSGLKATSTEA